LHFGDYFKNLINFVIYILKKHIFTIKHNVMDIQTRKLNIISYIAQLKDESFINKIEKYILIEVSR